MSKFCQYCGTKLEDADTFCPQCGKKQAIPDASPAPAAMPKPVPTPGQPLRPKVPSHPASHSETDFSDSGYPTANPPPVTPLPNGSTAAKPDDKSKLYAIIGALATLLLGIFLYIMFSGSASKSAALPSQTTTTATTKTKQNGSITTKPAASSSQKSSLDIRAYAAKLQTFEKRLSGFAERINSGTEDAAALKAVGNVLKDDILAEQNNLRKLPDNTDTQQLILLFKIQWKRADCMVRGLAGVAGAYAEGGGYYDEFQAKFAHFRQSHGI